MGYNIEVNGYDNKKARALELRVNKAINQNTTKGIPFMNTKENYWSRSDPYKSFREDSWSSNMKQIQWLGNYDYNVFMHVKKKKIVPLVAENYVGVFPSGFGMASNLIIAKTFR